MIGKEYRSPPSSGGCAMISHRNLVLVIALACTCLVPLPAALALTTPLAAGARPAFAAVPGRAEPMARGGNQGPRLYEAESAPGRPDTEHGTLRRGLLRYRYRVAAVGRAVARDGHGRRGGAHRTADRIRSAPAGEHDGRRRDRRRRCGRFHPRGGSPDGDAGPHLPDRRNNNRCGHLPGRSRQRLFRLEQLQRRAFDLVAE